MKIVTYNIQFGLGNVDQPAQLGITSMSMRAPPGPINNVRRQFGNMILSKTPIISSRLFPLPKTALRQRHNMIAGVLEGVVDLRRDGALRIYNAHLGARSRRDRIVQINSIRQTIARAPSEGGAWT